MSFTRLAPAILALLAALSAGLPSRSSGAAENPGQPSTAPVPAGAYTLDKPHSTLIFRMSHMGFSHFTARFAHFDSDLQFDPAHPSAAKVNVMIDPRSIETDNPPPGFLDSLRGEQWLDTAKFHEITFRSTRVAGNGNALTIDGELTLHGVTRQVRLDATYNGGYAGHPMDPHARIGFSAHGSFKRSDFGMGFGIPAPGTTMGVGDTVEVIIESEFNGPPLAKSDAG